MHRPGQDPITTAGPKNRLLAALPPADYAPLGPALEPVELRLRQVLYDPGETITHVHFPTTAVVSLLVPTEDGTSLETSRVGDDGLVGLPLALDSDCDTNRALIQVAGTAWRVSAHAFRAALRKSLALQNLLHRYTQVILLQTARSAVCNRRHAMYDRCARWLLETHDRVPGDGFPLTQDFLATTLAVRRATVSVAAGMLQQAGLISYHRGRVTILHRAGLEAAACDCYRAIREGAVDLMGRAGVGHQAIGRTNDPDLFVRGPSADSGVTRRRDTMEAPELFCPRCSKPIRPGTSSRRASPPVHTRCIARATYLEAMQRLDEARRTQRELRQRRDEARRERERRAGMRERPGQARLEA
jgi:CRP-like cAMP-binding protein